MNNLYDMIFKRKSFHLFRNIGNEHISEDELRNIEEKFNELKPLDDNIKVKIKIVKEGAKCHRGQEYCILFYSEKKDNYLQNIGYLGEQLDLYLVSKNIGTLWFGIGKVEEKELDGLDFVIMMAIAKVDSPDKFRTDMYKSKRKDLSEIWRGDNYLDIGWDDDGLLDYTQQTAVFNGQTGVVKALQYDAELGGNYLIVDIDGENIIYTQADINNLLLAYASNPYKFQGSQCKYIINIVII